MGYPLRREVRDLLPKGTLTDKEARLILELADACDDDTRRGWPGAEWLADKTDIPNPKRVGEFFASIAKKWVELRVALGHSADGRPIYSYPGENVTYEFPSRAELITLRNTKVPAKGGPKVPAKRGPNPERSPQRGDHMVPAEEGPMVPPMGGPIPSSSSSSSSSSLSRESGRLRPVTESERETKASPKNPTPGHRAVANLGVDPELIDYVVVTLTAKHSIKGPGWWITAERNETLAAAVDDVLSERRAASAKRASTISRDEHVMAVSNHPECPHGSPGGNVPKPDDDWIPCASCRNSPPPARVIDLDARRAG